MDITAADVYRMAPFAETLGVELPVISAEEVHAAVAIERRLTTAGDGLHGGAIMSISDLAAAVLTGIHAPDGASWSTAESTTHFLRPVRGGTATAVAKPIRVGRTLVNVEVGVYDDEGRHCAQSALLFHVKVLPAP